MKKLIVTLSLVASVGLYASQGVASYGKCIGCHGANGEKVALGKSKVIANMTKDEIVTALKGYKDGTYGGAMKALMKGQASSLSDEQITQIAQSIGK